jgi:HEAT repeat protein
VVLAGISVSLAVLQLQVAASQIGRDLLAQVPQSMFSQPFEPFTALGESATPALIEGLGSDEAEVRLFCLKMLSWGVPKKALPSVLSIARNDPEDRVRVAARFSLWRWHDPSTIPTLLRWAEQGDQGAMYGLGELGDQRALPILATQLAKPMASGELTNNAAYALAKMGERGAAVLLSQLPGSVGRKRVCIITGLMDSRTPVAARKIRELALDEEDEGVIANNLDGHTELIDLARERVGSSPYSECWMRYLADHDATSGPFILQTAKSLFLSGHRDLGAYCYVLAQLKPAGAAEFVGKVAKQEMNYLMTVACSDLELETALVDSKWEAIEQGLPVNRFGWKVALAKYRLGACPAKALSSYATCASQTDIEVVRHLLDTMDKRGRSSVCIALAKLGDKASADRIADVAYQSDRMTCYYVGYALALLRDPRAIPLIRQFGAPIQAEDWAHLDVGPVLQALLDYNLSTVTDTKHAGDIPSLEPVAARVPEASLRRFMAGNDAHKTMALRLASLRNNRALLGFCLRELHGGDVWKRLEAWRAASALMGSAPQK